jgi:hypothetical protein
VGQFYFSILHDLDDQPPLLVECADLAEVQQMALQTVGGLLAEVEAGSLIPGRSCGINVTDETGAAVMTLTVSAEITLHTASR